MSVALEHLSDEQWGLLVVHARVRLFESREQAEDLVQTILAEAADGRFDSADVPWGKLVPFLKAVVDKRARKADRGRRRRRRRESHFDRKPAPPGGGGARIAFREAARIQLRRDLARALRTLPREQRRAVVWKHLQGRTTTEIADLVGVTEVAVRQRLARARTELRTLLVDCKSW